MELNIKNIYDINCDWFAHGKDAAGNSKNGWNGEILVLGDNSCFGYATDNGHKLPTHLLVGAMVEGSGLTICKIHLTNSDHLTDFLVKTLKKLGCRQNLQFLLETPYSQGFYLKCRRGFF